MQPETTRAPFFASAEASRLFWLCAALLVLLSLLLNARVLDFGFLYLRDDDVNVTVNSHMGGLTASRLVWMFTDWSYVRRYIPLGWLNFSATYTFAGLDPRPYHAVGVALYGLNAFLVLAVVLQALRAFAPASRGGVRAWDVGACALAAGWWAFHPFRVETTAWVSGNLYGQSLAFLLISIAAYLPTYAAAGPRRTLLLVLACISYAASLLTYPVALGAPFILIGLDWVYARRNPGVSFRRLLSEKAVFLVPLAGVLTATLAARFAGAAAFGAVPGWAAFPAAQRLAQSAYVAAYYIWKPWWPFHLSPLYDTLMDVRPGAPVFVLSMAAVAAVSAAALLLMRRLPLFAVAWFGYLAAAAPFFGLTERPHMASDRYACFLTVIMAAVLAAGLAQLSQRAARTAAALASLALCAFLARLTWTQLGVWRDDRVHHQYVAGLVTNTELLDVFTSRLLILEFMRGNEASATDAVEAKLKVDPSNEGYCKAAAIIADKRKVGAYYKGVSLLAIVQEQTGLGFARAGEPREADDHLVDALRLDDRFYQAAYDRALVLLDLGRSHDALDSFFLSERWASPALTTTQKRVFLERLAALASAQAQDSLAAAARTAAAR